MKKVLKQIIVAVLQASVATKWTVLIHLKQHYIESNYYKEVKDV